MAHQDQGRKPAPCSHARDLHRALRWLMAGVSLSGIVFRFNCTWAPESLVFMGLLWAWSDERTLLERFATARKIITSWVGEQHQPATSYQAFIKVLRKWTEPLLAILRPAFRECMAKALANVWAIAGWVVFAADGSKVVGLFNRQRTVEPIPVKFSQIGINEEAAVRDLWLKKDVGVFKDHYSAYVPSHGVVLVKIKAK